MKFWKMLLTVGILTGIVLTASFVITGSPYQNSTDFKFSKSELFQMHDVIVEGNITVFTNDPKPYVVMQVGKYFKNPQNATHLTIWGDFGLKTDCSDYREECHHIVAYLYMDKNGIYSEGQQFERITNFCDADCIVGTIPENIPDAD